MRKLTAYNFITMNGFFKGADEDTSWHKHGAEEAKYSEEMLSLNNILLFGRKTYEHMAAFWPTPSAKQMYPVVALGMNTAEKIVFSNTLSETKWENSRVISGDIVSKMLELKKAPGKNMVILGSGSIINLFAEHKLLDELQVMIDPIAIGAGTPIFQGIKSNVELRLISSRIFKSGVVLLNYNLKDFINYY